MKAKRKNKMPIVFVLGVFLLAFLGLGVMDIKTAQAGIANHLVINEVHIDSIVGTGGSDDDWVEIYNPTNYSVSLDGWSIQKASASGGSIVRQVLSGTVAAGGYFLIVRNGANTAQALKDMADFLAGSSFSLAADNIVYLVNDNNNVSGPTDPNIVDFVGYGAANFFEGASAAPAITETKSISRVPDGEDTDQNGIDFVLQNTPTPRNSLWKNNNGNEVSGTVLFTVVLSEPPVINITPFGADIVFTVNSAGTALVNYGLNSSYGNSSGPLSVSANAQTVISLAGLECNTTYHYSVYAQNQGATENDQTADAVFTTLPCGIAVNSLTMTKASAKANNSYLDGWHWEFNITVWDLRETTLKMKFNAWSGASSLSAGGNMRFSVNNGANWLNIIENDVYPSLGADISAIDEDINAAGRQVKIIVQMKVPVGTKTGVYNSSYGILTE